MAAVVPIVLSVAVGVAGGESVRNMSALVVVHVAPKVEAAAVVAAHTAIVDVPVVVVVVVVIDGPPRFWRGARAFCCSGPEGGDCGPWVT